MKRSALRSIFPRDNHISSHAVETDVFFSFQTTVQQLLSPLVTGRDNFYSEEGGKATGRKEGLISLGAVPRDRTGRKEVVRVI